MNIQGVIEEAAREIKQADALFVLAGAGIGVDSGLPDFRGDEGFWKAYPPLEKAGISFTKMANPRWFKTNPNLAWGFYGHRLHLYRDTNPHDGFRILREICDKKPDGYFAFTSNVDGQFQKAGFDREKIVECHGSIHSFQCSEPCTKEIWRGDDINIDVDESTMLAADPLPKCPHCGALARPNILMFGDWSWLSYRSDLQEKRMYDWLDSLKGKKLVIIEIGAGKAVPTVRYQSESSSIRRNAKLIRINPRESDVPAGNISLPLPAFEGIKNISMALKKL